MKLSDKGTKFLQAREGCILTAYNNRDKWTIGYGNTYFEDGTPVKRGDKITQARADSLFKIIVAEFESEVTNLVFPAKINQSQFDALVSYCYNRGAYRFANTRLLDMVIANPNDPNIRNQFVLEWGTSTKFKTALQDRRKLEADLYFSEPTATTANGSLFLVLLGIGFLISK